MGNRNWLFVFLATTPLSVAALLFHIPALLGQQSSEGVLPPQAYLTERDSNLERELRRLRDAEAGMGEAHPKLVEVRKRIAELETELEVFRSVPNPFSRMEAQGVRPADIVQQLDERELRILVVRLAVDVKDLRKRVAELEQSVAPPR